MWVIPGSRLARLRRITGFMPSAGVPITSTCAGMAFLFRAFGDVASHRYLHFPERYVLTIRNPKPIWQYNVRCDDTFVAVLCDGAAARAFAEDRKVLLRHKQAQFWRLEDPVLEFVHRVRIRKILRQMGKKIPQ